MTEYNKFIEEKIKEISKEKVVLDVGGGDRFQKWLGKYEYLFIDVQYKTMDLDASASPDVIGDIHNIPLDEGSVGAVICSSVLEHVENPTLAVKEMHRVLKKGGKAFVFVPSTYPYHAKKGHYFDYWRFFDDTLQLMFKDFSKVEVIKKGGYFKAIFLFLPMQHKLGFILEPLSFFLDKTFKTEKRKTTSGYYIYAEK